MDNNAQAVLDLWFPDDGHWNSRESHMAFWSTRMHGGMDETIIGDFADLTTAGAKGELDHWADSPRGRLALLLVLDQFSRSLWRDTPAAFGQDIKATRLALEGVENGHYAALPVPWEREFYHIAISHCEGPDHLARMDLCLQLVGKHVEIMPKQLEEILPMVIQQTNRVRENIVRFGRHPHRNPILGRISTPDEEVYLETGDFPHVNSPVNQH